MADTAVGDSPALEPDPLLELRLVLAIGQGAGVWCLNKYNITIRWF